MYKRYASTMPRPYPPESLTAPSITATEFVAWLLSPQSVGPCPWFIGHADPLAPQPWQRRHGIDEVETAILAIMGQIDS